MKSLKYLNKYFFKYKTRLLLGFLFVAISNILLVSQGQVIKNATNDIEKIIKEPGKFDNPQFLNYAILLLALALGSGFFMFLKRQFIIVVSRLIEADLKDEIYNHYQKLDLHFYKQNNTGDLMNRISEDVGKVRMYVGPAVMYIVDTFFTVASVLLFMLSENWKLTLIVFIPLPILSLIIFRVSNLINKRSTKVQEVLSDLTTKAQESFSGIRLIKSYRVEKISSAGFGKTADDYFESSLRLIKSEALFQPVMMVMVGLSLVSIIFFGGLFYLKGEISVGSLPQFVFFVYKLTWPFASLGWVSSLIQRAAASQHRINQFLQIQPEIKNSAVEVLKIEGHIKFSQVVVTYPDSGIQALRGVSLELEKGKSYALIGPTGSGKSTLASLMVRLYDATSGSIELDGKELSAHHLHELRNRIGYVPQEPFLFSDTIFNNIAFGIVRDDHSKEEIKNIVEECAKIAGVHNDIMHFPLAYETVVGERGIMLSGGQKQRISIARAIAKKPQLLIFDDCLSAVDTETEEMILNHLKVILQGKTSLIISHRVSSVKEVDRIFYLKDGVIVEEGSHDDLIDKHGEYYQLSQLQQV